MSIEIKVPEESLTGFSSQARTELNNAIEKFANDLIEEANRLEAGQNVGRGRPEVTATVVHDAQSLIRKGWTKPKASNWLKALRISAAIFPLIVGVMYDKNSLQSNSYMFLFIIVIAAAILATTLSVLKE